MSSVELWKSFVDEFAQLHDGVFEKWVLQEGAIQTSRKIQK